MRILVGAAGVIAAVALLAGCGQSSETEAEAPALDPAAGGAEAGAAVAEPPAEPEPITADDLFAMRIHAARMEILVDRGFGVVAEAGYPDRSDDDRAQMVSSLRTAAASALLLREQLCERGIAPEADCGPVEVPVWLYEEGPASPLPEPEVLEGRLQELSEFVNPFVGAACDLGREQSGEELFCSVE